MVKNQVGIFITSNPGIEHVHDNQRHCSNLYFKVPADQRKANPDAYQPYLFSFGVYHAAIPRAAASLPDGNANEEADHPPDAASSSSIYREHERSNSANSDVEETQRAAVSEEYRDALNQFNSCSSDDGEHLKHSIASVLLKDYEISNLVGAIQSHDAELRRLYIQMPPLKLNAISPGSLAFRLALDSITIVAAALAPELFEQADDSPMIYPIARLVFSDGILLENQIPIFILFYAIQALRKRRTPDRSLEQVMKWYCEHASPFPNLTNRTPIRVDFLSRKPLLHYIYNYLTQEIDPQGPRCHDPSSVHEPAPDPSLPSASHLARCGVKFRAHNAGFQGITLISTRWTAELKIPRIAVSDNTVRSLHNLLAYEATARYPAESSVISYVHFMDCLIDTEEDVRVLVDAGVIRTVLGSHTELASMWNKLCISISCRMTPKDKYIMAQVEALAKQRWRRWLASYKEKYWEKQPWLIFSLVLALVLLTLTLLQTIYTMKG